MEIKNKYHIVVWMDRYKIPHFITQQKQYKTIYTKKQKNLF